MPETTNFNLIAWLRAIGSKRNAEANFLDAIRPTVQVADLSGLTPAHVPPAAFYGGTSPAAGAGRHSAVQVFSRDPGGCYVLDPLLSGGAVINFRTDVGRSNLSNSVLIPPQQISTQVPISDVTVGDRNSPLNPLDNPGLGFDWSGFPSGMWLPPGSELLLVGANANTPIAPFVLTVVGVPVSEGGDGLPGA